MIRKIRKYFKSLNDLVRLHQDGRNWYVAVYIFRDGDQRIVRMAGQPAQQWKIPRLDAGLGSFSANEYPSMEVPTPHLFTLNEVYSRCRETVAVYREV